MIVDISDNPYIVSFSSSLQMHIRRYKYIFLKRPLGESQAAAQEHREIIRALKAHDAEGAAYEKEFVKTSGPDSANSLIKGTKEKSSGNSTIRGFLSFLYRF
ncbi:FCD domain-containing protein [Paenibacillus elgii]